jgi:hypothetical protein
LKITEKQALRLKVTKNIRISPYLEKCCLRAICFDQSGRKAWFGENESLINWVNQQPLSNPLTCLGDGHPGI